MKAKQLLLSLIATMCCINVAAQVRVVDAEDGTVVPYANVYNAAGTFLGTTDLDGLLPQKAANETALAISHINYQSAEVHTDTISNGTIALLPVFYKLNDITVSGEHLDYICITAYARQYQIADSVPVSFSEGLYEFYFPRDKGKAKRHIVAAHEVMREDILNDKDLSSFYRNNPPKMSRDVTSLKSVQNVVERGNDTIVNRNLKFRGAKVTLDYNKKRGTCESYVDSVFSEKPFTFNFLGVHFQFTDFRYGWTFDTTAGIPTFDKLLRMYEDHKMRLWLNGKKGHVTEAEQFTELFVTSVGYVSKNQMKEAMKRDTETKVIVPPDIPHLPTPLTDAFEKMVEAN